jgi:hypothetical protein
MELLQLREGMVELLHSRFRPVPPSSQVTSNSCKLAFRKMGFKLFIPQTHLSLI